MASQIDAKELARLIKAKRGNRGLRAVAEEISEQIGEISFSTLSRVEQGNLPDLDTFMKLCDWLEISVEDLKKNPKEQTQTTTEKIAIHLRAERALDQNTMNALLKMVELAISEGKRQGAD